MPRQYSMWIKTIPLLTCLSGLLSGYQTPVFALNTFENYSETTFEYSSIHDDPTFVYSLWDFKFRSSEEANFMSSDKPYFFEVETKLLAHLRDSGLEDKEIFREAGVTFGKKASFSITAGRFVQIWGKADQYNPVDLLNGEDYSEGLIKSKIRRKIPRNMVLVRNFGHKWSNTTVIMPGRGSHRFPNANALYCLGDCIRFSVDSLKAEYQSLGLPVREEKLEISQWDYGKENLELANRLEFNFEDLDLGLYGYYIGHKFDLYQQKLVPQAGINLQEVYTRTPAYGFDMATNFGPYSLRTELLFKVNQPFYIDPQHKKFTQDNDGIEFKDEVDTIVGVDRQFDSSLYINAQIAKKEIIGASEGLLLPYGRTLATLLVRKSWLSDDLDSELQLLQDLSEGSRYLKPQITYRFDENWSTTATSHIMSGPSDSMFGPFSKVNQTVVHITASF